MSLFDFLPSNQDSNVYPRNIHTSIRPTQWTHSVKRLRMCEIVCWRKSTWHKQKHWRILHENDTKRRIQQALCKNLKKRCYTDLLHFSTCKHNLVSFFDRIVFWQYNCIVVFYIFFFFSGENARWYLF
jgi:hypothetical protein